MSLTAMAGRPVVVIDGCRTPFLRSGTRFKKLTAYDMGRMAIAGLLNRSAIDPAVVDLLVMGSVIMDPDTSNVAREAGLAAGMATIAAAYGYITDYDDPATWGADEIATDTADLSQRVLKAVTL